jgi:dolichol-phosphate mannosyltransferase
MSNKKLVNIILPVYNESEVIRLFYIELKDELKKITNYNFEIIFVLDKSKDNTEDILLDITENDNDVTLILLSRRFGHQLSLVAGINYSDGDAAIMMDSDLQHPPSVIKELIKKYEDGFDIVHTIRKDNDNIGFFKRNTSKLFYRLINKISPIKVSEGAADFRLISKPVIKLFKTQIKEQNQFLRGLFHWVGFNQVYIEFKASNRQGGKSKYNLFKLVSFAVDGITSFSKIPLRLSIYIGLLISVGSLLYAIYVFISFFTDDHLPKGWASMAIIISFIGGVQLIFLGIIGEYVGKIFDEVKNRPLFIVEKFIKNSKNEQL